MPLCVFVIWRRARLRLWLRDASCAGVRAQRTFVCTRRTTVSLTIACVPVDCARVPPVQRGARVPRLRGQEEPDGAHPVQRVLLLSQPGVQEELCACHLCSSWVLCVVCRVCRVACGVWSVSCVVCRVLYVVCRVGCCVYRVSCGVCRVSCVVCCMSCVVHMSRVVYRVRMSVMCVVVCRVSRGVVCVVALLLRCCCVRCCVGCVFVCVESHSPHRYSRADP